MPCRATTSTGRRIVLASTASAAERLVSRILVCVFLAFIHLLLELLRFLFIRERQAGQAILELKGMEEGAVLVVLECVVDFLVPYDAAIGWLCDLLVVPEDGGQYICKTYRDVDQFDPKCVANQVVG